MSSGQINDGVQGIADQLQIDLQNIPPPPAGKSYFLWLLGDKDPTRKPSLLKGPPIRAPVLLTNDLPVKNNAVHYSYPGDAQHNGLLCVVSRLLITLEDAHRTSAIPSSNPASWKYYAEFPQTPIPTDTENHLRGLDHLRHLFYNETQVKVLALPGGLDTWVLRDTEKILEFSVSARDDFNGGTTNYELMHNQFIRILDYLDGIQNVHLDVPPGTPFLADPAIAKVSLLTVDKTKQAKPEFLTTNPPGSLDHMAQHLSEFLKAPDVSPGSRQIAQNILDGLGNAKRWLEEVRADATELVSMTPEQLAQPSAQNLLEDLAMQVTYAYLGQLDPATNKVIAGVLQVHYAVQKLAAFDITTGVPTRL